MNARHFHDLLAQRMLVATLLITAAIALTPASSPAQNSDPLAISAASDVMQALGGKQAWNDLRGIRWSFGSEVDDTVRGTPRRHAWDKHTGWHRVDGKNREGHDLCVIHNLNDGQGMAWVAGNPIEGDSLEKLIGYGKATWINDGYWFLMPYKLRDPGVTLKYEGVIEDGGTSYQKLGLSFDNVGRTPGDRYWIYINTANRRVEKWEYLLQGREPPPVMTTWDDWEQHDGLWFPTAHRRDGRNTFTRDVETVSEFRDGEFERP